MKVVRTTDRKAGISASPWHEQVTRVHISDTVANKKRNVSVLLLRLEKVSVEDYVFYADGTGYPLYLFCSSFKNMTMEVYDY